MKRKALYIAFAACLSILTSCEKDLKIWDSETLEYAGRYNFQVYDETGKTLYVDFSQDELQLYNTASNTANEVWIDEGAVLGIKNKLMLSGNSSSFSSATKDYSALQDNILIYNVPSSFKAPTAAGLTVEYPDPADIEAGDANPLYLRTMVESGSITKNGFTTKGKNLADAIEMKIRLFCGTVVFKSFEKPKSKWADENIPEYEWKYDSQKLLTGADEVYVIKGHRYTGFAEDRY